MVPITERFYCLLFLLLLTTDRLTAYLRGRRISEVIILLCAKLQDPYLLCTELANGPDDLRLQ